MILKCMISALRYFPPNFGLHTVLMSTYMGFLWPLSCIEYVKYFKMADTNDLSKRMSKNVASMLPHIAATITERTSKGPAKIDLGTAENWLFRSKLLEICNEDIAQSLTPEVNPAISRVTSCCVLIQFFEIFPSPWLWRPKGSQSLHFFLQ